MPNERRVSSLNLQVLSQGKVYIHTFRCSECVQMRIRTLLSNKHSEIVANIIITKVMSKWCSARLALPGPEEKKTIPSVPNATESNPIPPLFTTPMSLPPSENNYTSNTQSFGRQCEPIIEEPTTPEPETTELSLSDIEDQYYDDDDDGDGDEIPTIKLDMNEFTMNLQKMQESMGIQGDMSKALVALNPQAASIPTPKLKNVSRLRTENQV